MFMMPLSSKFTRQKTYQQSVANISPASKKWTNTTEVIVKAAWAALSPNLKNKDKKPNIEK
jgi:hypothetical protein